jgi:hypothetical protein
MQAKHLSSLRGAGLIAVALLALSGARAGTPNSDAFPTFDNYLKIAGLGSSISGNEAAFQKSTALSKSGSGGIEDLRFTKELNKDVGFELDGHALFGTEDYLGKLVLTKNELGSFEVGYKQFRTYYDLIGGFFPLNKLWVTMTPEDLHVDRGEFWATVKLAQPNMPEFEFKFADGFRRGKKDNTVWGDSDFTSLPNNNPPFSQVRKLAPSYRQLDEHHQNWEGSAKWTAFGNTSVRVAVAKEKTNDVDTRYGARFAGEVKPDPTPASTVLLPPAQMNNQVLFSQTDGMKTDLVSLTGDTDTVLNEKVSVLVGFNHQDLDSKFSGDRPLYTSTPTAVGVVIAPSNNYLNLMGTSKAKIYTGSMAVEWKPAKDTFLKLALRGEQKSVKSSGSLTAVTAAVNATTGVITITNNNQIFNSQITEKSLTPVLDLRYTGFRDVALYAFASVRNVDGDEQYVTPYNPVTTPTPANGNLAANNTSEDRTRITVGGSWRASAQVNLRGEIFHKDNTNNAVGYLARSDGFVDNYDLGYRYNGTKVTARFTPDARIAFTLRYVYQEGKATVTGISVTGTTGSYAVTYPKYDSMDMTNQMFGATIDWTPTNQFYMQANVNVVANKINTIYPRAGTVPAAGSTPSWDANSVLQDSINDYVSGSLLAGAVLSKTDDLLLQATYYKADNYNPEIANRTMPYGAGAEESMVSVGLKHKFTDRFLATLKVGYIDSRNDTTGGNTNFRGPLGYVTLEYGL